MTAARADGRRPDEARALTFDRDFTEMADGSVLVSAGRTRVLCTASVERDVPRWPRGRPRSPVRPHPGDPTPHRALAACGDTPRVDRGPSDHGGLRRVASR